MARYIPPAPDPLPKGWRRLNDNAIERLTRYEGARVAVWKTSRGRYRTTVTAEPFATQEAALEVAATLFGAKTDPQVVEQIAYELRLGGWVTNTVDAERAAKGAMRVIRRPLPAAPAVEEPVDHVGALLYASEALADALLAVLLNPHPYDGLEAVVEVWSAACQAANKEREQ